MRLAIASVVAGLVWFAGLALWWWTLSLDLTGGLVQSWWLVVAGPVLTVALGHQARARIKEAGASRSGAGVAAVGLALGYLELIASLLAIAAIAVFIWSFRNYTF